MTRRDIIVALVVGVIIGVFALPTVSNLRLSERIPMLPLYLVVGVPLLAVGGLMMAWVLAQFIPVLWQFGKFGLIGVMNTAVDFGALNILIFATGYTKGFPLSVLNSISFSLAVTNSYFWNQRWVFSTERAEAKSFVSFVAVSLITLLVSSALIGGITGYIHPPGPLTAEQWANAAKAISVIFALIINFLGYKFIVFRRN